MKVQGQVAVHVTHLHVHAMMFAFLYNSSSKSVLNVNKTTSVFKNSPTLFFPLLNYKGPLNVPVFQAS